MIKNFYKINPTHAILGFFLGLSFFLCINIPISYATISTDSSTYYVGDPIIVTDDYPHTILYNTGTNDQLYMITNVPARRPTYNVLSLLGQNLPAGNYSILSFSALDQVDQDACTSYINCLSAPDFIMEAVFTVVVVPSSGGDTSSVRRRIISQTPKIEIFSPKKNSLFFGKILVDYKVTDNNDLGTDEEKSAQGLGLKPVSIFYTDNNFDWYPDSNMQVNLNYKNFIVKDLSSSGQYEWSPQNLTEGNLYRIIVDATDNYGLLGEEVSDYFTVDFTPPIFKIKTDLALVKSGSILISVESSEVLQSVPKVFVTQKGGKLSLVEVKEVDGIYEGYYIVKAGYDGSAQISVQGTDLAGNTGTEIISGGTFSVGVNTPPKPNITSAINKTVTNEAFTIIKGIAREDTEVVLFVNGTTTATIKPDSKGNFTFDNIKLDKIKNKGLNYIKVISRDIFGTVSESSNIEIKYNIPPTVSLIKPTDKSLLSGTAEIVAKGVDENSDTMLYTFEIISLSDYNLKNSAQDGSALGGNWATIASNITSGIFAYDTTESDDGDYMLRVKVSDGNATVTSLPVSITIKSSSSYFRFENGRKTVTNKSSVTINGKAILAGDASNSASIKLISYSLDDGETWENVNFEYTVLRMEQKFSVTLDNLKEGIHPVLWMMTDSLDLVARGTHTIIIDNTAPKNPVIKNPKNNLVITKNDDEDLKKNDVQINIAGTAEAGSIASLVFEGQTLSTKVSLLGEFIFSGITINKVGKYEMQLFATDEAGNISSNTVSVFTYNNPPEITFINPKPFGALSGKAVLSWNITDIDGDTIKNVILSFKNSDGLFTTLLSNAGAKNTYTWDTSRLLESRDYELKITATDSIVPVSVLTNFIIDKTSPKLLSFDIKKDIVNKKVNFNGSGTASDAISGIEYVEYSIKADIDNDKGPWFKGTISKGYLKKQASFTIKYPKDLADSSYTIYARVVDAAGNVSNELSQSISVDKTSPNVGSFFISKDNLNLIPDQDGKISYYKNSMFTLAVSIEKDTKTASVSIGSKNIKLNKNIATGLWEATTTIDVDLAQDILVTATDDSENVTKNKKIGLFTAIEKGGVILENNGAKIDFVTEATIHIYKYNETAGRYDKFIPTQNGLDSVIKTDENGKYSLTLPIGKYQLIAVKSGFRTVKKDIVLSRTEIINDFFVSKKISGIEKFFSDIFNKWFY